MSVYDALAELAERELELVSSGALDGLTAIHDERERLVESLPERPPAEARFALERAAALQARVTALLEERLEATGAGLRHLSRGRTAIRGYAPQLDRVKLVDRAG